VTQEVKQKQDF